MAAELEEILKKKRLNLTQLLTLYSLAGSREPVCQRELAERVGCTGGNMTQVLDQLARRRLVRRIRDPRDRRYIRVSLTPKSALLLQELVPVCNAFLERLFRERSQRFFPFNPVVPGGEP